MSFELKIFSGSANYPLAKQVAKALHLELGRMKISKFADGEIGVAVEENVRGCDVFVLQPTSPPVNDNMMELCLITDALRRASAKRITMVMTYFAYGRQDRKTKSRVPISASLMARFVQDCGVDHVLSVDLHSGQIQGFFSIPVDDISARSVLRRGLDNIKFDANACVTIVAPDAAGAGRAENFKNYFQETTSVDTAFAVMNKWKLDDTDHNEHGTGTGLTMELVGKVDGTDCIIVDDMLDTAKTLLSAVRELKRCGAKRVFACITHALFNDISTLTQLVANSDLELLIVTNTLDHERNPTVMEVLKKYPNKIVIESVGNLVAETVRRIHFEESLIQLS